MSRAGSANRTWVQIHLGEEPADAGGTREFVSLPHPRTGKDCRYMLRGDSVLELQIGVCSGRFLADAFAAFTKARARAVGGYLGLTLKKLVSVFIPLLSTLSTRSFFAGGALAFSFSCSLINRGVNMSAPPPRACSAGLSAAAGEMNAAFGAAFAGSGSKLLRFDAALLSTLAHADGAA